jgi:hypothetical protein
MWTKEKVHALLDRNPTAVARALLALYARQTADERQMGFTAHANGVGFNKNDAEWLSDIARKYQRYGRWASQKQLDAVRRRMKFYSRQLVEIANANLVPEPEDLNVIDVEARQVEDHIAALEAAQGQSQLVATGDYI